MKRRSFLQLLGVAPIAATVAAHTEIGAIFPEADLVVSEATPAVLGSYFDYANFSSFALAAGLDPIVENAALELGLASARELDRVRLTSLEAL